MPAVFVGGRELEDLYEYPAGLDRAWVQANFVASADGAATVNGDSECLSGSADRRILALARDLADVVMVGVATAVAGAYQTIQVDPARRAAHGLRPRPSLAMVTNRCSLGPDAPQIADCPEPPVVITCRDAPLATRRDLVAAGVDLVTVGDGSVDLRGALDALAERGLRRVDCEGGPTLFGGLIGEDLVDALCLTVSPVLVGGLDGRISTHPLPATSRPMVLESVLQAEESLFVKYRRLRDDGPAPPRPAVTA
ncbi:dihydrofolate reductase family protein [Streptomyces dioscori]|uniref:dihydrofolate reductase family protein n=1 Tax=Streptomyces dioscori TaxID=2109333 RepID=UPI0018FE37F9|nr:dihydrofolate reductase family protein [Streptomyces dioscori]